MVVRAGLGALSEICGEAAEPFGDGVVPFYLAGPAAFDGVLGEAPANAPYPAWSPEKANPRRL
jgi:hypothetical protein